MKFKNNLFQNSPFLFALLFAAMLLILPVNMNAQKSKNLRVKPKPAKNLDWTAAFPTVEGYRRTIEKSQVDDDGKLYYQTARYEKVGKPKSNRLTNQFDSFEISLHRYPNLKEQLSTNREIEKIKIGGFDANRVPRTCGLDFREYSLEIFPDDKTVITIGIYPQLSVDGIELAGRFDYEEILAKMMARKNIY